MEVIQIAFTHSWNHKLNNNNNQKMKTLCTWVAKKWSNAALDQR